MRCRMVRRAATQLGRVATCSCQCGTCIAHRTSGRTLTRSARSAFQRRTATQTLAGPGQATGDHSVCGCQSVHGRTSTPHQTGASCTLLALVCCQTWHLVHCEGVLHLTGLSTCAGCFQACHIMCYCAAQAGGAGQLAVPQRGGVRFRVHPLWRRHAEVCGRPVCADGGNCGPGHAPQVRLQRDPSGVLIYEVPCSLCMVHDRAYP